MTYQFELDVTTSVDAHTVEQIVSTIVQERTGKQVDRILTKMNDGKFDGFEIHFQREIADTLPSKKEHIIDKTFKVFKWDQ
jgi:DNA replication initiation complex subunit (GINS family)